MSEETQELIKAGDMVKIKSSDDSWSFSEYRVVSVSGDKAEIKSDNIIKRKGKMGKITGIETTHFTVEITDLLKVSE